MGSLSREQIAALGLAAVGTDVTISDRCSIYGAGAIRIGDHVRIDDFAVITARAAVALGSYVHISAFAFLSGQYGITIGDFCSVSVRATLLSGNDDYSGESLMGPLVPEVMTAVHGEPIVMERYCVVGAHSVVLPGVVLSEGSVLGALSLVKDGLAPWGVYAGVPARLVRRRSREARLLGDALLPGR